MDPRTLFSSSLPYLCTIVLALAGCGLLPAPAPSDPPGSAAEPKAGSDEVSAWRTVFAVDVSGLTSHRWLIGYLEHRHAVDEEEGIHYVHDTAHRRRGFVLPSGRAYVYEETPTGGVTRREISFDGLDQGVLDILGVTGRVRVEYGEVSDQLPAPGGS